MNNIVRIGTRNSNLALWQAKKVQKLLLKINQKSAIIPVKTDGDIDLSSPIHKMGITGVFTKSLDVALLENKIDTILWSAAAIGLLANSNAFEHNKPSTLKYVMFSGEVMHNKVLNYWRKNLPNTKFVNLYGPTEITSVCTYFIIEKSYKDKGKKLKSLIELVNLSFFVLSTTSPCHKTLSIIIKPSLFISSIDLS